MGGKHHDIVVINDHDGYECAIKREKLDKARIERVKKLYGAVNAFASKSAADFSRMDMYGEMTIIDLFF